MGRIDDKGVPSNKTDRLSPSSLEPGWEKPLFLSVDGFANRGSAKDSGGNEDWGEIVIAISLESKKQIPHGLPKIAKCLERRLDGSRGLASRINMAEDESGRYDQKDEGDEGLPPFWQEVVIYGVEDDGDSDRVKDTAPDMHIEDWIEDIGSEFQDHAQTVRDHEYLQTPLQIALGEGTGESG